MKHCSFLFLLFLSLGFRSSAQNNVTTAATFMQQLSKGKYAEAVTLFDPSLSVLNAEVLQNGWQQIQTAYGKYQSHYLPEIKDSNASNIVLGVQFENALHGFACNFNDQGHLVSFTLAAAPNKTGETSKTTTSSTFAEKEVTIPVNGGQLKGTILLPASGKAQKYVLIIAGSGPTDRNGNSPLGVTANTYKLLAEALAKEGIASLRYDKRLIAASNQFSNDESKLRFDDFAQDAVACIQYLKETEKASKVYVAGHSEGSFLGILAVQKSNVSGYISLCGPGENIALTLERQLNNADANNILNQLKAGKTVTDIPSELQAVFRPSIQPYLISWMQYEPTKELSKLKLPVLIIAGTTDLQVLPADAEMLHKAMPQSQLLIIEGMNHVLKDAPADQTQNLATYSNAALPLNKKLVNEIVRFLNK